MGMGASLVNDRKEGGIVWICRPKITRLEVEPPAMQVKFALVHPLKDPGVCFEVRKRASNGRALREVLVLSEGFDIHAAIVVRVQRFSLGIQEVS